MITFKNDDEKHAWDLYVTGALARGLTYGDDISIKDSAPLVADDILMARHSREPNQFENICTHGRGGPHERGSGCPR